MRKVLTKYPGFKRLKYATQVLPVLGLLQTELSASQQQIRRIVFRCPALFGYPVDETRQKIEFLAEAGVPKEKLAAVVARDPTLLLFRLDHMLKAHKILTELDLERQAIGKIIMAYPRVLSKSVNSLIQHIDFFQELGLDSEDLGMILSRAPSLFGLSTYRTIATRTMELVHYGIQGPLLRRVLIRAPEILSLQMESNVVEKLEYLVALGLDRDDIHKVIGKHPHILCFSLKNKWIPVLSFFRDLGLTSLDLASLLKMCPQILAQNILHNLQPKARYLINDMGRCASETVRFPTFWSYSLESRIRPRHLYLKARGLDTMSLNMMLACCDEVFAIIRAKSSLEAYLHFRDCMEPQQPEALEHQELEPDSVDRQASRPPSSADVEKA